MRLVTHLRKSGSGMSSLTACGRNILRTPIATHWIEFKTDAHQCVKCAASKFATFKTNSDVKNAEVMTDAELSAWIAEAPDAWKAADDVFLNAARK